MDKIYLLTAFLLLTNIVFGQNADSARKQKQFKYYKQKLGIAEDKAGQVNTIHDQYKASLRAVTDNPNLSDADKRKAAERLMGEKNNRLAGLLTADQLDAVIPTAERKRSKNNKKKDLIVTSRDTARLRDQMSKTLVIPKDKVQQVTFIQLNYKDKLRRVLSDTAIQEPDKKSRITQLIRERNKSLKNLLTPEQVSKIVPAAEQKL